MSEHDDLTQGLGHPPERGGCPGQSPYMTFKFEVNINWSKDWNSGLPAHRRVPRPLN